MGKFGKFLKRELVIEDVNEDDSQLLKRLKQWKQGKQDYQNELAGDMTVDMDKDQIQMMIVKLMTIETQLKELNAERRKKSTLFDSNLNSVVGSRLMSRDLSRPTSIQEG